MSTMFWIWAAAAAIFLILELASPGLIFACFVAGSLVSGTYSYFYPEEYYWQIGIFALVAVVLLPLTRTLARRVTKPSPQQANMDALVGRVGMVTKAIDRDLGGQIKVEGELWTALADVDVAVSTKVRVLGATGTRLHVEKLDS